MKTINGLRTADAEINRFAIQVHNFSQTSEAARLSLSRYCSKHPDSEVSNYLKEKGVLEGLAQESELVERDVQSATRRVVAMMAKSRVFARIQWSFRKESILQVCIGMESIKSSIGLILHTVQLEVAFIDRKESPHQTAEEIERLETEMYMSFHVLRFYLFRADRIYQSRSQTSHQRANAHEGAALGSSSSASS